MYAAFPSSIHPLMPQKTGAHTYLFGIPVTSLWNAYSEILQWNYTAHLFLMSPCAVFYPDYTSWPFHQRWVRIPFSPQSEEFPNPFPKNISCTPAAVHLRAAVSLYAIDATFYLLPFGHVSGSQVIPLHDFDVHFCGGSDGLFSCDYWPFVYIFLKNVLDI